ncbi:MAG: RNA-binding S4 domain-containing protein [Muribaculaceae bacterium]|nr:RNA-binding S4 domain-containing protein [Muribaculaceae bacterium]
MEEAKKPKRPRIGTAGMNVASENVENDARYEKVNYSNDSSRNTTEGGGEQNHSNYQQRNYGYNRNQGGYNQNRQGGYGQQGYNRQGGYGNNRNQGGYNQNRNQGYNQNRNQGGYNQNRNQGYNRYNQNSGDSASIEGFPQQESGYNQNRTQGGYQTRNQGGYNQNRNQGYGNNRNQGYGNNRNQGGYNQNRNQGGYNQNRNQGYGNNRNQGGYGNNRNQGGYGNSRNQGGYNQNRNQGFNRNNRNQGGMKFTPRPKQIDYVLEDIDPNEQIRLNKYMANAGICSRREADEYITGGKVKVNGVVVTELGTKISRDDVVEFDEKVVTPERKCYVLLNKPKDCVTTSDDPNGRTTVLDIVKNACQERIYPVGRLDRNTTGVLLLTNDGDLASKLTHPKYVKKKIYHVWTDRDIAEEDMQRIADGIELEDGEIHADAISYVSDTDRNQAGIEIHSGRNRIVRRIFESLGYRVTKLDRVYFAGLTKKNLPRGRWRYLTQEEVNYLRMGSFE